MRQYMRVCLCERDSGGLGMVKAGGEVGSRTARDNTAGCSACAGRPAQLSGTDGTAQE